MKGRSGGKTLRSLSVNLALPVLSMALAGCFSAASPPTSTVPVCAPIHVGNDLGLSTVRLPDGAEFRLYGNTAVEISMAGCVPGLADDFLQLLYGEVAGKLGPGGGFFVVSVPGVFVGRSGGLAVASYAPEAGLFGLDCVLGPCELGPDLQHMTPLAAGEGGELDAQGNVNAPTGVDAAALFEHYGDWLGIPPPPTASPSPSATPDLAATATSGCATFESEFPGTPCP